MIKNNIEQLKERRQHLDLNFLKRIEFGLFEVQLTDYISFNTSYLTRRGTLNPHFGLDQFKFSFNNRMRPILKGQDPDSLM